jgi:hypothetical protein
MQAPPQKKHPSAARVTQDWATQWETWVRDHQPDTCGWWNLSNGSEPADWFAALPPAQKRELNFRRLQGELYRTLVSGVTWEEETEHCDRRVNGLDLEFVDALHQYNQGAGYWDPGWQVIEPTSDGYWAVKQQDLTIEVLPEQHLAAGIVPVADMLVSVKMPKNLVDADRYMAVGNAGKPTGDRLQIYLHCDRETVLPVMRDITTALNQVAIPFSFAVPYEPFEYPRWDAGILIIEQQNQAKLTSIWQSLVQAWADKLLPAVPLMAKPLLPGIAIAQLRADQSDFGWWCCQLLAEGLLQQPQTCRSRLAGVEQIFAQAQLDWAQPYRAAGAGQLEFLGLGGC